MNWVYVVIRSIGEDTTDNCIKAVKSKFGKDFEVVMNFKPLEMAAKETVKIGIKKQDEFDWVWAVDADVIVEQSREWIQEYCEKMRKEFKDRLFCFNGWLNCTKRGLIVGSHFYRTKYCEEVYNNVKDISFQYKPGREESEMCWWVRDKMGIGVVSGIEKKAFGSHLWKGK